MTGFLTLFHSAVVFGTVIMFGALGEILTEKSGNLNLGVPGVMYLGGISGLTASFIYETGNPNPNGLFSAFLALFFTFLVSAL